MPVPFVSVCVLSLPLSLSLLSLSLALYAGTLCVCACSLSLSLCSLSLSLCSLSPSLCMPVHFVSVRVLSLSHSLSLSLSLCSLSPSLCMPVPFVSVCVLSLPLPLYAGTLFVSVFVSLCLTLSLYWYALSSFQVICLSKIPKEYIFWSSLGFSPWNQLKSREFAAADADTTDAVTRGGTTATTAPASAPFRKTSDVAVTTGASVFVGWGTSRMTRGMHTHTHTHTHTHSLTHTHTCMRVLVLLFYVCPHTCWVVHQQNDPRCVFNDPSCVFTTLYACPHYSVCVSSYYYTIYAAGICLHVCVLLLLY